MTGKKWYNKAEQIPSHHPEVGYSGYPYPHVFWPDLIDGVYQNV
jgi:hypothetical protein